MKGVFRLLLLIALVAGAIYGVVRYRTEGAVPVTLVEIERGSVESTVANTRAGTVKACRRSKLAPAIGGQVARLSVREGDQVTRNQILMEIWNRDRAAHLKLAASEELAARARAEEACLIAEVAEREARRQQKLWSQSLVSEESVDRASTDAKAKRAACGAVSANLEVARARVEAAEAALEQTYLRAPFDGIVAEVNAEIGEFVTPSPPGIPTLPALDLIDAGCLYITAPIDEVDAPAIQVGMDACVSFDAFPEPRCNARVRRIAPYVLDREKQARTVEIEVEFSDAAGQQSLLPGYSADVEVVLAMRDNVLRVPTEAVLEGNHVLVYQPRDGTLERRKFVPGISNWRFTEIVSGLAQSERVVLSVGREGVVPGARVTPESSAAATRATR